MIKRLETNRRKAKAQPYLDKVIDQMALADTDMKAIIRRNAAKLIELSMTYSYLGKSFQFSDNSDLEHKVSLILEGIRNEIFNIIYIRCYSVNTIAFEKEDEKYSDKFLLLFLSSKIENKTISERIDKYVNLFRREIEAYIAAGFLKNMSHSQILNLYILWLKYPYSSPFLYDALKQQGFKAEGILSKGFVMGTGTYNSVFNNLIRFHQDTIFRAYNHTVNSIWLEKSNIIGWYTVRGSNYPCPVCDEGKGIFHPKEDFFYGYHPRCCCIMLPVYSWDIF